MSTLTSNTDFKNDDCRGRNFEGADLRGRNFEGADCREANFRGADLRGANFRGADLRGANFESADCREANFEGAKLLDVTFINANLSYANLRVTTGLYESVFASAILQGAHLPDYILFKDDLEFLKQKITLGRSTFLLLLLSSFLIIVSVLTTKNVSFILPQKNLQLPILSVDVPIHFFYWLSPLILTFIFVYFHFYLVGIWETLSELPKIFPDGRPLTKKTSPWMVLELVKEKKYSFYFLIQNLTISFLVWWLVPLVILILMLRYIPNPQNSHLSFIFHITLLVFLLVISWMFKRKQLKIFRKPCSFLSNLLPSFAIFVLTGIFNVFFFDTVLVLDYQKISLKENSQIDLSNKNLNGMRARFAILAKANLMNSSLKNADLSQSNLDSSIIDNTDFSNAILINSSLKRVQGKEVAIFRGANLTQTNFSYAIIPLGTQFSNAVLLETDFRYANLRGVSFKGVRIFERISFQCSDLRDVIFPKKIKGMFLKGALLLKKQFPQLKYYVREKHFLKEETALSCYYRYCFPKTKKGRNSLCHLKIAGPIFLEQ